MMRRYLIYVSLRHCPVNVPGCTVGFGGTFRLCSRATPHSCFEAEQKPLSEQTFLIEQFNTSEIDLCTRVEEDSPNLT